MRLRCHSGSAHWSPNRTAAGTGATPHLILFDTIIKENVKKKKNSQKEFCCLRSSSGASWHCGAAVPAVSWSLPSIYRERANFFSLFFIFFPSFSSAAWRIYGFYHIPCSSLHFPIAFPFPCPPARGSQVGLVGLPKKILPFVLLADAGGRRESPKLLPR